MLLAQDFVALFDRLPKDLIGVAFAAAGGYFLWLKFTANVDAQMNGERARCDKALEDLKTVQGEMQGEIRARCDKALEDLKTVQGEMQGEIRAMRVWRDLAWWLRSECIRLGATEADLEQRWPKEDQ